MEKLSIKGEVAAACGGTRCYGATRIRLLKA